MSEEKTFWLDSKKNVDRLFHVLLVLCGLLLVADIVHPRHNAYKSVSFEAWPFFYGIFGFVCFVVIVLSAKMLRKWLMRREGYYD